jgi:predicted transcriptional regulator
MKLTLEHGDKVVLETKENTLTAENKQGAIVTQTHGRYFNGKNLAMRHLLEDFEKRHKKKYSEETVNKMIGVIRKAAIRGAKALNVNVNYLCQLIIQNGEDTTECLDWHFIPKNFYDFEEADELNKQITKLKDTKFELDKEYQKKYNEFVKETSEQYEVFTQKEEATATIYNDIKVNCPYCDEYCDVEPDSEWHPGLDLEENHECESCGKMFSVVGER